MFWVLVLGRGGVDQKYPQNVLEGRPNMCRSGQRETRRGLGHKPVCMEDARRLEPLAGMYGSRILSPNGVAG